MLWQTESDWEMWVIGDACTDDTEAVVRAFDDPRIHFHNLAENVGEQSGPNNEGIRRARADVIAFLNHDDLWFPDHLEVALSKLESSGADMTICLDERIAAGGDRRVSGVIGGLRFEPGADNWIEASSWLVRRPVVDEVGPWRPFRTIHLPPSQDWLSRVWRAQKQIVVVPRLTVVAPSSLPNSYIEQPDEPQRSIYRAMQVDAEAFRSRELAKLLLDQQRRLTGLRLESLQGLTTRLLLRALLDHWLRRVLLALRIDPRRLRRWRPGSRRGSAIDKLRRRRGLDPLP